MRPIPITIVAALAVAATASSALGVVSQGAFRIGADAMWASGIDGTGQTVAVLDQGFDGLDRSVAAGELPPLDQMTIKSFDAVNGITGRDQLEAVTEHGVRMAEIVRDVAPGARLVLVNYHSDDEFVQATRWIADQGIPIVSHSNSILGGPFDGTGPLARAVDAAAARGVLWVNSSGNFAKRHWRGTADANGVPIPVAPQPNETLAFGIGWSGAGVDAVVSIERQQADGTWLEVARSDATRRTPPVTVDGGAWRAVVRQVAGAPVSLDVFSRTVSFGSAAVPDGSIATPGDAAGSLTVGAATWGDLKVADYSSRGPTADGRQKPEIVGPTYVTSNLAFPGTGGTSASAPHVAGAAVLLRQQFMAAGQPADAASLRASLLARARDIETKGADAISGAGMVRVDFAPPIVRLGVAPGRRPVISVQALDDGTMNSVTVKLDGRQVTKALGPVARYRSGLLKKGRHRIAVTAEDSAGNVVAVKRALVVR
jgi:hypothetical protein